jgi:hypothetical protein
MVKSTEGAFQDRLSEEGAQGALEASAETEEAEEKITSREALLPRSFLIYKKRTRTSALFVSVRLMLTSFRAELSQAT